MHINTKAIFEWDNNLKQYVEIHNEGYEYEGELALAITREFDPFSPQSFGGGFSGGGVNQDVEEFKNSLEKEYGAININVEDGTYTLIETKTEEEPTPQVVEEDVANPL